MWVLYIFDVILHETERENIQVRTLDKKGDSLGTEEDLHEQYCQREEQECVSLRTRAHTKQASVHTCETGTQTLFF